MHIAFIGHRYHQKTRSSQFWIDLLKQLGEIECWFGDPGEDAVHGWGAKFDENHYDVIVVWQLSEAFDLLSGRHPNVVFVPMYDAMFWGGELYWKAAFSKAKIVCFSWALRTEVMRRGAVYAGFQYYPDPENYTPVTDFDTLRGFLWYRRREISPELAFRLCRGTQFERFVIHDAPDPGHESATGWIAPPGIHHLDYTRWSTDGQTYAAALRDTNVFFAPRPYEGIGMSVLEAMASGHCVVAPNTPTMNEYISNGGNGLLYVPERRTRLDFGNARSIGARARESVARGHERWKTSIPSLLDFVATPTAEIQSRKKTFIPVRNRFASDALSSTASKPLVSVVTVCRNAENSLETTIRSVTEQVGIDFEYVVLDGLSTDHSIEIIARYKDKISIWRSAADRGAYDAMNVALGIASGEWVLYMNAGDTFASEDALRRMFANVPEGADVVYGHHIYRQEDGAEELHRAAEFETTWMRLQSGALWFDWLNGIPCHQATAVRRDLLNQLQFDPQYKIAADHDLLFRARAQGAQFYNCDEVIAVYVAGGLSAQQYALCRKEWADIARSHGDTTSADKFYAHLETVNASPAAPTWISRLSRLAGYVISVLHRMSPSLARWAENIIRNATLRRIVRRLIGRTPTRRVAANPLFEADLDEGIEFCQPGLPDILRSIEGMSHAEPWGRWTVGRNIVLRFCEPLPARFTVVFVGHAFAKNANRATRLRIGGSWADVRISDRPGERYEVVLSNPEAADALVFDVSAPTAPNKLWPEQSTDSRALGLALVTLRIIALRDAEDQ